MTLLFSLFSLGLIGGFSHCVGMCGPFVLTQVSNSLEKTPIEKFSEFQRLKNIALIPYHLGRISTYCLIAIFCSALTSNIKDLLIFKIISILFLTLAIIAFISFFKGGKDDFLNRFKLRFKSKFLENISSFFSRRLSILFLNPKGLKGYALGLILGFIPCGMVYSAIMITSTIGNPAMAGFAMLLFGIGTIPSLFLTACSSIFLKKVPEFTIFIKALILLNIVMLALMIKKIFLSI